MALLFLNFVQHVSRTLTRSLPRLLPTAFLSLYPQALQEQREFGFIAKGQNAKWRLCGHFKEISVNCSAVTYDLTDLEASVTTWIQLLQPYFYELVQESVCRRVCVQQGLCVKAAVCKSVCV